MRNGLLLLCLAVATGCGGVIEDGDVNLADDPNADPAADPGLAGDVGELSQGLAASPLIDAEEAAFLTLINTYRTSKGLAKLRISVALSRAAQAHSTDMATQNYFSHTGLDGSSPWDRMARAGYGYNTSKGENLAAGSSAAQATFDQWNGSPDHNTTMLGADFRVIGIARAYSESSTYKWYWTTTFGGYTDALLSYGYGTILANGGFEAAPLGTATWGAVRTRGGWYTYNAGRSTSGPAAGSYQMTVRDPDPGSATFTQIVLAAPGISYTFQGSSRRLSGATGQTLYLEFLDASYVRLSVATAAAAAGASYAAASVAQAAPARTRYVRVFAYGAAAAGHASSFAWDATQLIAQ